MKLQRELDKMRGSRSSWSQNNSTYYNQSEASTVKSQLDTITRELDDERKKCDSVIGKQLDELEEVKKQREEGAIQ